ncbi:glycogen synthase GlgA [Gluconobacter japonicus]|uniref:glycogen synthase GlgA n=1 Tax=Gluconobacter japonicus TaxID=376620 RepID=UPI001B8D05F9|nr:glycogen synthase GlgA [Gluconobacter japonicus]MBS1049684.1 glycogen synthase GlgA [Gluconobacter japonicus]
MLQNTPTSTKRELQLLSVAAEMYPFIKTGGLGDVVGSLPDALEKQGVSTRTLLPGYPAVLRALSNREEIIRIDNVLGHTVTILCRRTEGNTVYALDVPALYDRPGNPYLEPSGQPWSDNGIRYAVLSRVGALIAAGLLPDWKPDVVLTHDWHAGLVAPYLHYMEGTTPPVAHVIHNLAFQGLYPYDMLQTFGLPDDAFTPDKLEYYGQISFMKGALQLSDRLISVSPTYVEEIQTPEEGMGLDGVLRARSNVLTGILNGVDLREWNPMTDPSVFFPYAVGDIIARRANKRVFQAEFGLPQKADALLLGMVSRLTTQKGADLLARLAPRLFQENIQLAVVGTGDEAIMQEFAALRSRYPDNFVCHLRYSEVLGHRLHSAVDASLIPSRFEPCGLTQFHALRYGSIPIASRVGGLSDTIIDANSAAVSEGVANGILFSPTTEDMLYLAIRRAQTLFRQKAVWARMQRNGALHDVSWNGKAAQYAQVLHEMSGYETKNTDTGTDIAPRRADPASARPRLSRQVARMPRTSGSTTMSSLVPFSPRTGTGP